MLLKSSSFVSIKIFNNDIYNALSGNFTVKEIINMIKKYKKNIKLSFVNTKIMNQLSYNVDDKKLKKIGLRLILSSKMLKKH